MPGFLRKKEFEKVVRALWDKVKEKFVEDVACDDVTKILSKTKNGQTSDVIDLSTYAKKDEENHFTKDNLFKDVFLESVDPYVENLGNYTSVAGGVKKTGRRDFTSHSNGNSGYVESLLIRVRSDIILQSNLNIKTRMGEIVDAGGNVYLSNTDSIVTDSIGADIMQRYIGVGVGQFKLSSQTDRLFYQSSNSYQLGDKVVWSGVKYFAQKNTDFFQDKIAQQQGNLVDSFDYCISENEEYRLCRVREGEIKVTVTNTIGELLETKRYRIKE